VFFSLGIFPTFAYSNLISIYIDLVVFRDVPLPSGYEPSDANLFVKYLFPYPTDANQSGKTKYISGTQNPVQVYQKGSFLRSDKLLGTCEWRLDQLESHALLEESLPLKEGRKAVGGLLTLRIRVREPLGDAKLTTSQHRWLVLDN
ncbi:hypothetical protein OESDEN_15516, partial [Oesophagostomum dentatum]